jgi:hypothetical protein
MKLFGFNLTKDKVQSEPSQPLINTGSNSDSVMAFGMQTSLPIIRENNNKEYVQYLTDEGEQYPYFLDKLYNNSPTHQAIVSAKALMAAGDGGTWDVTMLTDAQMLDLNKMLNYFDGKDTIQAFKEKALKDYELYGAIALEIIWSLDFSKVVKVNRISPKHVRSGKFVDGEIKEYFYSRNYNDRREEVIKIAAFDINDKENYRQMLYLGKEMVSNEYYYEPSYIGGVNWAYLEAQTGLFYKSLMENGFNPSVIVRFFRKPTSFEERDEIVSGLKKSFGGIKNSGKAIVMFSDGKELAPEVTPIEVSNIDKQFTVISDQIVTKILTSHRVTTPELFGVAVPGKLGTGDFATQVEAFQRFVIQPSTNFIDEVINKIFKLNGLDVNYKTTPIELQSITEPKQ